MGENIDQVKKAIESGKTAIGIELGSTRIKTVLIDEGKYPIATGSYDWENSYINNIWTYDLEDVWKGIQGSYKQMTENVNEKYGLELKSTGAIGISGMMHGYLVFDKDGKLLTPFRTWRNNITGQASDELSDLFNYPIPQRFSIAHLYQAILNNEKHVPEIDFMTTLAGYIHWKLTGKKVLGIGEASGVFPIDLYTKSFNSKLIEKFDKHISKYNFPWKLQDILPKVLIAGENAGELSEQGAKLLDTSGNLKARIPLCPPEGDAVTGMVATNSISLKTCNVSAGTSVFAMVVLEKELSKAYKEIDLITTPEGKLVAMVHSNNCTSDYDAWISLFSEANKAFNINIKKSELYDTLLGMAINGDPDCGGLLSYGYISGEHITEFEEGRPLFVRSASSKFNLANFMRVNLFSSLAVLRIGLDILIEKESVNIDVIKGHGGFFKTRKAGQRIMAAAVNIPISVAETAGEGGPWGIALLAYYMVNKNKDETLEEFLRNRVFAGETEDCVKPDPKDVEGYNIFLRRYKQGLAIEKAAVENLRN